MLKVDQEELDHMESQYSGIIETIHGFENAILPPCSNCGSSDTAMFRSASLGGQSTSHRQQLSSSLLQTSGLETTFAMYAKSSSTSNKGLPSYPASLNCKYNFLGASG